MPNEPTFTQSDFLSMLNASIEQMGKQNLEAIKEMKKLPEHEQEKLDKKLAQEKSTRMTRMQESIAQERTRREREFHCEMNGHVKSALGVAFPAHALSGQVNSDGHYRAVCIRCFKSFPKVKATDEQCRSGIGLLNAKGLNAKILYTWHKKTVPNCEDCKAGGCAVRMERELANGQLDAAPQILPSGKVAAAEAVVA